MSTANPSAAKVPEKMTEEEARRFIEQNTARFNSLREKVVQIKTRAEEGGRQIKELLDLSEQKLGTRDEAKVKEILNERMTTNGERALAWVTSIDQVEAEVANLSRAAAPGR